MFFFPLHIPRLLKCLCVCEPLMNAHNPVLLREAILPLKVTTLTEMNRTSMVQRKFVAPIQLELLCSFNWVNIDFIFLILSPLHFCFNKEAWRCLNGNKCNMTETNSANITYEAGALVMKMQWGRRNEDGSGSSGALIILVLEIFHMMLWWWDSGICVCDRLIYLADSGEHSSSGISWHAEFVV